MGLVLVVCLMGVIFCLALHYLEEVVGGMYPDPADPAAFLKSMTLCSAPVVNIPDLGHRVL